MECYVIEEYGRERYFQPPRVDAMAYALSFPMDSTTHTTVLSGFIAHRPLMKSTDFTANVTVVCRLVVCSSSVPFTEPSIATGIRTRQSPSPTNDLKVDQPLGNTKSRTPGEM
jgi:hypothetical protein